MNTILLLALLSLAQPTTRIEAEAVVDVESPAPWLGLVPWTATAPGCDETSEQVCTKTCESRGPAALLEQVQCQEDAGQPVDCTIEMCGQQECWICRLPVKCVCIWCGHGCL